VTGPFSSRYPGYDVLAKATSVDWDEQTWQAIQERLTQNDSARFFTAEEVGTLAAVVDRILPQPDRTGGQRVPIVPWIDAKLFHDRRDGYRYEGMPPQRVAWRLAIQGIEQAAQALHDRAFTELSGELNPPGAAWRELPAALFFKTILCIAVVKAYYSHPTAWSEIGYSGPSSPRGHVRIWIGGVDPWEAHEHPTLWETE
jgi:hypothetical protein